MVPEWVRMFGFKKKSFRQSTQNAELCLSQSLKQFFNDSAINLLENLCYTFLVDSGYGRLQWAAVPRIFLLFFWEAAKFGLLLSFASFWTKNAQEYWRLNYFCFFNKLESTPKRSSSNKQLVSINKSQLIYKVTASFLENSTCLFAIFTIPLTGNMIVYNPSQLTNGENYFNYFTYKENVPTLTGNKHFSVHFFRNRSRPFQLSTEIIEPNPSEKDFKVLIPTPTH